MAGITTRHIDSSALLQRLPDFVRRVEAEQVHGGSVAMIGSSSSCALVPGADALVTGVAGVVLLIRTADCLPVFFADPRRGMVGLAHAGWRGLACSVLANVVSAFRTVSRTRPEELSVAIGPAIRSCCYEVGPEFTGRFGPFVTVREGRRTCDLIGVATEQLRRCGVRAKRLVDAGHCTGCEPQQWFSLRREGQDTGRLTSLIMVRP